MRCRTASRCFRFFTNHNSVCRSKIHCTITIIYARLFIIYVSWTEWTSNFCAQHCNHHGFFYRPQWYRMDADTQWNQPHVIRSFCLVLYISCNVCSVIWLAARPISSFPRRLYNVLHGVCIWWSKTTLDICKESLSIER